MPNKRHILNSIAAVEKRLGRAPSLLEFVARAGISKYSVFQVFPRWNDAVRAAGLQPCRLYGRPKDNELLKDWGETVRKRRDLPSRRGYRLAGKYEARTLETRFGGWSAVPRAFRSFAKGKREWADVIEVLSLCGRKKGRRLPNDSAASAMPRQQLQHARVKGRATYGNPTNFRGLRYEPVNEQGVVLLFGMLANDLGYLIEAVQKGFPDCEAMRQIAPERWQRVHIEFEFESKNFRDHGHPVTGCDVIVCWRHNWDDCPDHIEVLELSTRMKSLANSVVGLCQGTASAVP
jgi:hypothetical protein